MSGAVARPKPTPSEVNDGLRARLDLELGHPGRRVSAGSQDRSDREAVQAIAELLRIP